MQIVRSFLVLMCMVAILASSTFPASAAQSEAALKNQLKQRAQEYWDYKVAGKLEKAYTFEDPASLDGRDLTEYIRSSGGGVQWLGIRVLDAKIKDNKGGVLVAVHYKWSFLDNNPKDGFETNTWDHWILVDGKWLHLFYKPTPAKLVGKEDGKSTSEQPQNGNVTVLGTEDANSHSEKPQTGKAPSPPKD